MIDETLKKLFNKDSDELLREHIKMWKSRIGGGRYTDEHCQSVIEYIEKLLIERDLTGKVD